MEVEPYLPFGIRVLDTRELFNNLSTGETLWIAKNYLGKLWIASRTFNYEVDWTYHFPVSKEEAKEIDELGYARYWFSVKESEK